MELSKIKILDQQLLLMAKENRKKKFENLQDLEDDVAEVVQPGKKGAQQKPASTRGNSAKSNRPPTQQEADKGETFLTDMLFKQGKTPTKPPKSGATKPVMSAKGKRAQSELKQKLEEKESAIDSDEY